MINPVRATKRFVISRYSDEGDREDFHVVRPEGQTEVAALLERLQEQRRQIDEQLMTMDQALDELEVPEADRAVCAEAISDWFNKGTNHDTDYTETPFPRKLFVALCQKLPERYGGSWLQRETISIGLENANDLANIERIVDDLADAVSRSSDRLDHFEVTSLLRKIARALTWVCERAPELAKIAAKEREPA